MVWFPQDLAELATVVQALAAVAGLVLAGLAYGHWQQQAQSQTQASSVVIHNYTPPPRFGPDDVGTRK